MNLPPGIIKINASQYKGAQPLRIDKVPASLSGDLAREILATCRRAAASCELMAVSDRDGRGRLDLVLLLRAVDTSVARLSKKLRLLTESVRDALTRQGFVCRTYLTDYQAERQLPAPADQRLSGVCFYPPETSQVKTTWYLPGRYASPGLSPVDLASLFAVVAAHSGSILLLQANAGSFLPGEKKKLQSQAALFDAVKEDPMARTAAEIYQSVQDLSALSEGFFEVNFIGMGSPAFAQDLAARVSLTGLRAAAFSYDWPGPARYLYRGNELMSAVSFVYGHESAYRNKLPKSLHRLTHLASLSDLAASFPLPRDLEGLGGLQINRVVAGGEPLPDPLTREDGIYIGQHDQTDKPLYLPVKDLSRHGAFTGKPGSGKTVFAIGLLSQIYRHKGHFPFLAIEPTKKEYRSLLDHVPGLQVYTPGRQDLSPMPLNIFLPPRGVRLEQYLPVVESIFSLAITMTHPLDVIFPQVISLCYARYGWRPDSTRDTKGVRIFGLHEFIREFRRYAKDQYGQSPEDFHNIETGGIVRLMAMLRMPAFDTDECIDIESLLSRPTVIELDALANNRQRAIVMGILLLQIDLYIKQRGISESGLKNVILIDEAHLLLDQLETGQKEAPRSQSLLLETLQNMTLILRDYGTALIFGDQSARRLTSTILENVNFKVMLRADSLEDTQLLEAVAKMTPEMTDSLAALPPGQGYLRCDRLQRPVFIRIPNYEEKLPLDMKIPDEQIRRHMQAKKNPPYAQCRTCTGCREECYSQIRSDARFLAGRLADLPAVREALADPFAQESGLKDFLRERLAPAVRDLIQEYQMDCEDLPRLTDCARIHLIRELLLLPECRLSEEVLTCEATAGQAPAGS